MQHLAVTGVVLAFALFIALTGASTVPDLPPTLPAALLATLERTTCYGPCPAYKVIVHTDGRVEWEGHSDVKVTGHQEAHLGAAALAAVRAAFERADFMSLGDGFDCHEWTDAPSVALAYHDADSSRAVLHYLGCRSRVGVERLCRLEEELDLLVGTQRWVGQAPISIADCMWPFEPP